MTICRIYLCIFEENAIFLYDFSKVFSSVKILRGKFSSGLCPNGSRYNNNACFLINSEQNDYHHAEKVIVGKQKSTARFKTHEYLQRI
jgi:hypothetical protein